MIASPPLSCSLVSVYVYRIVMSLPNALFSAIVIHYYYSKAVPFLFWRWRLCCVEYDFEARKCISVSKWVLIWFYFIFLREIRQLCSSTMNGVELNSCIGRLLPPPPPRLHLNFELIKTFLYFSCTYFSSRISFTVKIYLKSQHYRHNTLLNREEKCTWRVQLG